MDEINAAAGAAMGPYIWLLFISMSAAYLCGLLMGLRIRKDDEGKQ